MASLSDISIDVAFRKFLKVSKTILFIKLDRRGRIQRMNPTAREVLSRFGEPMGANFAQYVAGLETLSIEDMIAQFFDPQKKDSGFLDLGTEGQPSLKYYFTAEMVSDGYMLFGEPSMEAMQQLRKEMEKLRDSFADAMRQLGKRSVEGHRLGEVLHEAERRLEQYARVDPLTDMPNRRTFLRELHHEYQRFMRYGRTYSVTLCEIRGLETLTGTANLAAEEAAIVMVGEILKNTLRTSDSVARFGDRQFAVLQYETPSVNAHIAEERIRDAVDAAQIATPAGSIITLATGSSEISNEDDHPEDIFRRADDALRQSVGNPPIPPETSETSP